MDYEAFAEVVHQFDDGFGAKPDIQLRVKLVLEEMTELCEALGHRLVVNHSISPILNAACYSEGETKLIYPTVNKEQVNKEWGDLMFVVSGFADVFGIDQAAGMFQVATKNWAKLQNKDLMKIREDGKVVKPEGDERFK